MTLERSLKTFELHNPYFKDRSGIIGTQLQSQLLRGLGQEDHLNPGGQNQPGQCNENSSQRSNKTKQNHRDNNLCGCHEN
jgi:hypothetical protein